MFEIDRVNKNPAPVIKTMSRKYEVVSRKDNGDTLTNALIFADSNIALGVITSEEIINGASSSFFMWVGEDDYHPPLATNYVEDVKRFQQFVTPSVLASFAAVSVGVFFSAWLLALYPVLLLIYMVFVRPRKPTIEVGMGSHQRVNLPSFSENPESEFKFVLFKHVLQLPNRSEITKHVQRMVNTIGADRIEPEYLAQWLNLLSRILEWKEDFPVDLIPFTVEAAQELLDAIVDQNEKIDEKNKKEIERAESIEFAVQEYRLEVIEGQLNEQAETQRLLALDRIKNENRQLFGEELL